MTIVADTSERHDCLCGCTNRPRQRRALRRRRRVAAPSPATAATCSALGRGQARPRPARRRARRSTCSSRRAGRRRRRPRARRPTAARDARRAAGRDGRARAASANTPHPLDDRRGDVHRGTRAGCTAWLAPADERRSRSGTATPERERALPEHRRATWPEAHPMSGPASCTTRWSRPGPRWARVVRARARRCASSTSAATRRSTACSTTPTTPPSATRRPTRSSPSATSSSSPAPRCCSNEGDPMMTITGTTCAYHDTIGGACSRESNTLRYGHHTLHQHACVDNFLDDGLAPRAGQARPRRRTSTGS